MTPDQSPAPRRGIILLFVLALLALFSLVTVTFVLVARQGKQSAQTDARKDDGGESYGTLLDSAALKVIRGSRNPLDVIQPHSLLEDVYGSDGMLGTIVDGTLQPDRTTAPDDSYSKAPTNPQYLYGTQVQQFLVQLDPDLNVPLHMYSGAYNGRTVTMLTGAAAGRTSRVLESVAATGQTGAPVTNPANHPAPNLVGATHILNVITFGADLAVGDRILINGAPFNGTGFGYGFPAPPPANGRANILLGSLDPYGFEYALLPNPVFFVPNADNPSISYTATVTPWYTDPAGPGGADETYDAVDYQNMLLALHVPDNILAGMAPVPIPSLHRPELIYYWLRRVPGVLSPPNKPMNQVTLDDLKTLESIAPGLLRKIMLRPNPIDHPEFTGSNPGFLPCSLGSLTDLGRFDVDNDNDGICDSIWVDLGSEVQTAPDGRKYKPLFALLVIDQEGKFNLNAQGTLQHIVYSASASPPTSPFDVHTTSWFGPYAGTNGAGIVPASGNPYLAMGQGYGPAEINLSFLFDASPGAANFAAMRDEYGRLLLGETNATQLAVEGRYGEGHLVGKALPMPGYTAAPILGTAPNPSRGDWIDEYIRSYDMPANYFNADPVDFVFNPAKNWVAPNFGSYGSPPDVNGNAVLGLDERGQPWYGDVSARFGPRSFTGFGEYMNPILPLLHSDKFNDPYEIDLSLAGRNRKYGTSGTTPPGPPWSTVDNPFSPDELERLLRFNDVDSSSLPDRLLRIAPETFIRGNAGAPNRAVDAAIRRAMVSTEGWDMPVPTTILTPDLFALSNTAPYVTTPTVTPELAASNTLRSGANMGPADLLGQVTFTELIRRRLVQGGFTGDETEALKQLVSWDLARGERLDLNRVLGNGRDDNGNRVVDDPLEALIGGGELMWNGNVSEMGNPGMDHNNDGVIGVNPASSSPSSGDRDDSYARQLMARHLYVLAWSLVDQTPEAMAALVNPAVVGSPAADPLKVRRELARRLAQWAVNMVDFRDRDSICTGFEYDVYPFRDDGSMAGPGTPDGLPWDVDDEVRTRSGDATNPDRVQVNAPADGGVDSGVVWGCEKPELIINETIALHDRRTKDTDSDAQSENQKIADGDTDFDQVKRPVGSLFVELYAPWNATETPSPDVYTFASDPWNPTGSIWQIDLDRVTVGGHPIWRLAVVDGTPTTGSPKIDDPPEATPLNASGINPKLNRVVYFVPDGGAFPAMDCTKRFHPPVAGATTPPRRIRPNSYLVIGPDDVGTAGRTVVKAKGGGQDLTIQLDPQVDFTSTPALTPPYPNVGTQIKQPLSIVINDPRRLSISEPYRVPPGGPNRTGYDLWDDTNPLTMNDPPASVDDVPWDHPTALPPNPEMVDYAKNQTFPDTGNDDTAIAGSTHRTIFLQRLADPTQNWNARSNPYISVDRMPVDLTVYNSEDPTSDPSSPDGPLGDFRFGSRQRGKIEASPTPTGPRPYLNFWSNRYVKQPKVNKQPAIEMVHTLGYLNDPRDVYNTTGIVLPGTPPAHTLGRWVSGAPAASSEEITDTHAGVYAGEFVGDASQPAPWLTWNNRPYISKHELLLVPATSATEMLHYHSARKINPLSPTAAERGPYLLKGQPPSANFTPEDVFAGLQFGFVSPLLMSQWVTPVLGGPVYSLPNFHRMLEFVTVPTRFTGTEMHLKATQPSPAAFGAGTGTAASGHRYNPPFNRISALREPGKVNINTITSMPVWQAIMNQWPDGTDPAIAAVAPSTASWLKMLMSRQGYGDNSMAFGSPLIVDPSLPPQTASGLPLPTFFTNPFRSYAGTYLVPLPELQLVNFSVRPDEPQPVSGTGVKRNEIDATLLRADQRSYAGSSNGAWPLFSDNSLSSSDLVPAYGDPLANPYFHYQGIQKLSNLVTTRSNVYAVWITVGFFEVEKVPVGVGHPDGWRLKQELGSDTGEIKRHRAFYMIDRSIPVGFQRGQDYNVQQTILVRRIIE